MCAFLQRLSPYTSMSVDHDYSPPASEPASPCIGVCVIHAQTQLCEGCYRSLDEITHWWDYSTAQKQALLAEIEQRLERIVDGTFFD